MPTRLNRRGSKRDDRPDWRDPDMKPLMSHRVKGLIPVEPDFASKMAAYKLEHDNDPTWQEDDTYNLRRR